MQFNALTDHGCHSPEVVAAFRARCDEIVGHGRINSEQQNDFDEAGEAVLIREATETIARHEGRPPAGWLSPGVNPSEVTLDLLQEAGYTNILDWPMDDQPVWIKTRRGRLLSLPYPHEVNDIPMIMLHHGDAGAFAHMIIDNFDEMMEQSQGQPLVYCVSLHTFIVSHSMLCTPVSDLVERLLQAKRNLRLSRELRRLDRIECLFLNDIGYPRLRLHSMDRHHPRLTPQINSTAYLNGAFRGPEFQGKLCRCRPSIRLLHLDECARNLPVRHNALLLPLLLTFGSAASSSSPAWLSSWNGGRPLHRLPLIHQSAIIQGNLPLEVQ